MPLARACAAIIALFFLAPQIASLAPAQPPDRRPAARAEPTSEKRRLQDEFEAQYDRADWPACEATLRRLVEIDRKNFVPPYNLACVLAMEGKTDDATEALQLAVQRGFADLRQLQSDPNLDSIRRTEVYRALIDKWDTILEKRSELNLEAAREQFGPRYSYETDPNLRLQYVSAFDPAAFAKAKEEIERDAKWWDEYVGGVVEAKRNKGDRSDAAARERDKDPWVMVILPTRKDYQTWASNRFGAAWSQIGGSYSDDEKTLVAADLGPTLRHEFWHVMHWRQMRRLGQMHPVWIMEGLCSLPEDVEVGRGGEMIVLPSWRTNTAKRLALGGRLTPWDVLFATQHQRFVTSRPLAQYAQARTIFMYLSQQGKLKEWYAAYVDGYREDPTGKRAFETVFGKPAAQVEKDYKAWLRALPSVPEEVPVGGATFPFQFDVGEGDGVVIKSVVSGGGSGAAKSGLKLGDVITQIDGQGVHDMSELVRVLGQHQPGQEVDVAYRRGRLSGTARVTLIAQP